MNISYDGILECFQEGNALLGEYSATLVSVHDPDDYLNDAKGTLERESRKHDILAAYSCLHDLKSEKKVESIGIGVKNPEIIEYLLNQGVHLDWTMIAGVLTPFVHTTYVRALLATLQSKSIQVINSAVFNSGFLVGEDY
jgi:D-threo-aldose 1-dehydrogenase